jgi:hypothetical protein
MFAPVAPLELKVVAMIKARPHFQSALRFHQEVICPTGWR